MDIFFIKAHMLAAMDMLMTNMLIDFLVTLFIAVLAFNAGRKYERSKRIEAEHENDWEPKEPTL
ncbi:hypothetical protein GJ697_01395 [Pseudoduganella sp. FT25W]|uniref:Uncharacterized protein n=1 Tax=Duganella alba TaxID=2666081 RepID=A0A6L5Q9Y2_9BURK|nr:hypothetical protein [Duganella alba]MRX06486.1 hypothetical protein [Duganella alba]MRX14880.1 hypothetical protein [Duganella alba]